MEKNDFLFLKKLTEAFGPSSAERPVRELISQKIKPYACHLRIDRLGNLIAVKGNGGNIVVSAHMDEVGFMVTGICEDGTLKFSQVGGIDPNLLPSKRLIFSERGVLGVIGSKPVHLNNDRKKSVNYTDLYIDIGADSKKEAEDLVSLGDLAVFSTETEEMTSTGTRIKGKAIDDRLGCFLLCKLICDPSITDCTFLFSVQEEIGLAGASAFAKDHRFDYGIALDVTTPNDLPGVQGPKTVCKVGCGPVISFADGRCVYDFKLISNIFKLLEDRGIRCQTKTLRAGGNEASSFRNEGCGMRSISISVPCRYIHGPVGIVREEDIIETEKALRSVIDHIKNGGFCNG